MGSKRDTPPKATEAQHLLSKCVSNLQQMGSFTFKATLSRLVSRAQKLLKVQQNDEFGDLTKWSKKLLSLVHKLEKQKFMHAFINRDILATQINLLSQDLNAIAQDIHLQKMVDAQEWALEDQEDRKLDMKELDETLQHLVDNEYKILNVLELKQVEYMEAIEALQKNLTDHLESSIEKAFTERALAQLRRATSTASPNNDSKTHPPPWLLTSWEIDLGEQIAQGGFAQVLKATWLSHTTVAVKRLHLRLETQRLRDDFLREVKTWFPLRHPHILPLLGACASAERPFMVMPFMSMGHLLQYMDIVKRENVVDAVENAGIRLLYEISLGMQYLHSRGVVHGDLKAVNVLVNEHGTAHISDFGFASIKQFSSTRNTATGSSNHFGGTLRWMSPERLQGGRLSPPVDVYAFAITCYEVLSDGDVPMTEIPDALIYQQIVNMNHRPSLPLSAVTLYPQTNSSLFKLMQACWNPNPLARPTFSSIALSSKRILDSVKGKGKEKSVLYHETLGVAPYSVTSRRYVFENRDEDLMAQGSTSEELSKRNRSSGVGAGLLNTSEEDYENLHKEYEPGTWGALLNDLLPMFPASTKHEIQSDMLLFGRQLVDNVHVITGTGEFQDFLYAVKIAAGYETSRPEFLQYMQAKSFSRQQQIIKANIHMALAKLGSKTRHLVNWRISESKAASQVCAEAEVRGRIVSVQNAQRILHREGGGVFGNLINAFYELYYMPIILDSNVGGVRDSQQQDQQRTTDSTVVGSGILSAATNEVKK